jgi:serine phosphatase RsbU (regulator of sigma subunit)
MEDLASTDVPSQPRRRSPRHPGRLVAAICAAGLLLTVLSSWAVARVDRSTEERLLELQTRQAAAVLSTAVSLIQQPMRTALDAQAAAPSTGRLAFDNVMSGQVGEEEGQFFVSASLWRAGEDGLREVASLGTEPWLEPGAPETRAFLERALTTPTTVVDHLAREDRSRIVYALADAATGFVILTERAIPANRRAPVDNDAAYSGLNYAIYLGDSTDLEHMTTTDRDPSDLPLDGLTDRVEVPFGDTVLTLVTTPRRHLGSTLSQRLPLIIFAGGLLLTAAAALVARRLVRSRADAEANTATITSLYQRVDSLYEEQRALSVRLQRALLPQANPLIPRLEVASRYVAGARGVDIGGDWYSLIPVGDDEFAFVVGDVSGHGVDAVAVMARARFTLRAYLVDGHGPAEALEKCSRQFDIVVDDHMITAVVGVGNSRTGEVRLASAGHPPPLLVTDRGRDYVETIPGPPLGIGAASYHPITLTMGPGSTLLMYTDGLVERRGESIDVGLRRLSDAVGMLDGEPVDALVEDLVSTLRHPAAADDIAVLALRRAVP